MIIKVKKVGNGIKIKVFAENYRGFKNIDLDLDKNLFLVGDNSSGKSSIIYLISSIMNSNFSSIPELDERFSINKYDFFSPYFNNKDVIIGYAINDNEQIRGKILTIKKYKDIVIVTKLTSVDSDKSITIKRTINNNIYYKFDKDINSIYSKKYFIDKHLETSGYIKNKKALSVRSINVNNISLGLEVFSDSKYEKDAFPLILSNISDHDFPNIMHSGPVRGLPEKFYDFDRKIKKEGSHFPSMWVDLEQSNSNIGFDYIREFGKESGLFDNIYVKKVSKNIKDSPLFVLIEKNNKNFLINQVGVGVSQSVPILIESVFLQNKKDEEGDLILLQQPELHLHPKAQAALGEFIYKLSGDNLKYIIETHSDFLIDRFRYNIKNDKNNSKKASIIFCYSEEDGNYYDTIEISNQGELIDPPERYREFFINELIKNME